MPQRVELCLAATWRCSTRRSRVARLSLGMAIRIFVARLSIRRHRATSSKMWRGSRSWSKTTSTVARFWSVTRRRMFWATGKMSVHRWPIKRCSGCSRGRNTRKTIVNDQSSPDRESNQLNILVVNTVREFQWARFQTTTNLQRRESTFSARRRISSGSVHQTMVKPRLQTKHSSRRLTSVCSGLSRIISGYSSSSRVVISQSLVGSSQNVSLHATHHT